jgi:hypothetical protein
MWFRRKKQKPVEPVRRKRKPREWLFPKENLIDILKLYDDMMSSTIVGPTVTLMSSTTTISPTVTLRRLLPRYLFWQKVVEVLPEVRGFAMKVEETQDWRCLKLVEVVPNDKYESETQIPADELNQGASSLPTIEESLDKIEAKPISDL